MKKFNLLFFLTLVVSGSVLSQSGDISQFKWLIGSWSVNDGHGIYSEGWKTVDENVMTGAGSYVVNGDTVLREILRIQRIAGFWTYIPVINKNRPVLFTLISSENDTWIFENKEHDYPQRVVYAKESDGSLKAWIEGERNGKFEKEEYPMNRIDR